MPHIDERINEFVKLYTAAIGATMERLALRLSPWPMGWRGLLCTRREPKRQWSRL